jgi:hypothetical protein
MTDFGAFRGTNVEEALSGLSSGIRTLLLEKNREIAELQATLRAKEAEHRQVEERLRDEIARLRALVESGAVTSADHIAADSEATVQSLHVIEEQARVIDEQQRRIRLLQRSARTSSTSTPFVNTTAAPTANSATATPMAHAPPSADRTGRPSLLSFDSDSAFTTPTGAALQARLSGIDRELADRAGSLSDERVTTLLSQQAGVRQRLLELRDSKLKAMQDFQQTKQRLAAGKSQTQR